jgi:thioester reductase-like protein
LIRYLESKPQYTLLTGATGLVGRYLLKDLLAAGVRLAVIVRDTKRQLAADRISQICDFWEKELGHELPRPVCLTGDVGQPGLGLSVADLAWVETHCDTCFHNAAILRFDSAPRHQEPWLTNLDGTQNVVEFCEATGIPNFHYVSTAYVCGDRSGVVMEGELRANQGFRNDYEKSKYFAEKLVRDADCFQSTTIYRPAVITADAKTGYTNTYHGLHLYLRLMALLIPEVEPDENGVRHTEIRLPMTGEEQRNVVTVDWVSEVMTKLFLNSDAHGKTFHIAPTKKLTPKLVIESCYNYFNSTGVQYVGPEDLNNPIGKFERDFLANVGVYTSYDKVDPIFDTTNLKKFAGGISCPEIDEPMIWRFLKFGENDKWGKRKKRFHCSDFQVEKHLTLLKDFGKTMKSYIDKVDFELGFDVVGDGGGQWYYSSRSNQIHRGLPNDNDQPVVRIKASSLQKIVSQKKTGSRCDLTDSSPIGLLKSFVNADVYN